MNLRKLVLSFLIISLFMPAACSAQTQPCLAPEASQFDFWIGKWNAEWKDQDGNIQTGTNNIAKILDGCVIEENFNGNPAINFIGKSFTIYDVNANEWKQTWVDNNGSYMTFTGGMQDEKMILSRKVMIDGKELFQRMIFFNIEENSFDWNWESSKDGKEWKLKWQINYERM